MCRLFVIRMSNSEQVQRIFCFLFNQSCLFFFLFSQDFNEQCPYSISPVTTKSQKLLRSPRKATRKISRIPFKVLDAPELQDDFYLNLVDWSSQNVLAVGLGSCVYLWSACTSQVSNAYLSKRFNGKIIMRKQITTRVKKIKKKEKEKKNKLSIVYQFHFRRSYRNFLTSLFACLQSK